MLLFDSWAYKLILEYLYLRPNISNLKSLRITVSKELQEDDDTGTWATL